MTIDAKQLLRLNRREELDKDLNELKIKNRNDLMNLLVSICLDTCNTNEIEADLPDEFSSYKLVQAKMEQPLNQ